jgi:hypothetical protein
MVFYCDEAYQKKHWNKKGHKKSCRAPGEIQVGDDMLLQKDDDMLIQNGAGYSFLYVKVIACVDATTNQWQVQVYGTDDLALVHGDQLHRLRPPPSV